MATCETNGHLWGADGRCVMCKTPKTADFLPSKKCLCADETNVDCPVHGLPPDFGNDEMSKSLKRLMECRSCERLRAALNMAGYLLINQRRPTLMSELTPSDELLLRYSKALETIAYSDFEMKVSEANSIMRRIARDAIEGRETFDKTGRLTSTRIVKSGRQIGLPK